jgi:hypothetical protein
MRARSGRCRRPLYCRRMNVAGEFLMDRRRLPQRRGRATTRPRIPTIIPCVRPSGRPKLIDASFKGYLRPGRSDGRTRGRHREWRPTRLDLEAGSANIQSKVAGKCQCMSTGSVLSERDLGHPNCEVASESRAAPSRSHSSSFDQRRRPETFRTAIAIALFWPTRTTRRLPRVTPV